MCSHSNIFSNIKFGFARRLPLILQTQSTECSLACLSMIAGYYGFRVDLATLRRRLPISLKGVTLAHLIKMAKLLNMESRPMRVDLEDFKKLKLPCILHWNFNHFVVLRTVGTKKVTIHDPATGIREVTISELSKAFTGVALELWPSQNFKPQVQVQTIRLRSMMGQIRGFVQSVSQILVLAVSLEVFAIVSPLFLQWVIDNVIVSGDYDLLTTLALGFGLLMLLQQTVSTMRSWGIIYMSTSINIQWRANVFTHLIRLPVEYFEKRHLGDIVSRFGTVDQIQHTLTTSFLEALLDGVMALVTLIMIFIYSQTLGLIAFSTMTLYALFRWAWYSPLRSANEQQMVHTARQESHFLETIRGIKPIKLFQRHDERRAHWLALLVDQINADVRMQRLTLSYRTVNGVLFGIENILIVWLGARMVLSGDFSVGVLMAFNAYKGQFNSRVGSLIDKLFELRMLGLQGERLADIVLSLPEPTHGLHVVDAVNLDPTIEVSNLRYRYSDQEQWVLDDVSFQVTSGESVAIVGASGCGKTTLMNILLGILLPTEGKVTIGGIDVRHIGVEPLRHMIGTVLQDDVLFAGSIAENISFFDPNADQSWVEESARLAAINLEISAMPMRYNTLVGDMGTILSGGQKQRVLLARALYKRPKILFLDEATSHLDIAKEYQVNNAVKALNITRIIIAHREETIASTNRVITLQAGKILQHAEMSVVCASEQ